MSEDTLYERLGGYEGIAAFANYLMPYVHADSQLGRFTKTGVLMVSQERNSC